MQGKSGRSSPLIGSYRNLEQTEQCGMVMASACQAACQSTCSICEVQCEAFNVPNELNGESNDNNDLALDESFDSSSQNLAQNFPNLETIQKRKFIIFEKSSVAGAQYKVRRKMETSSVPSRDGKMKLRGTGGGVLSPILLKVSKDMHL